MNYSPKLKRVMEIMKNTMKAEGIGGVILLHEPGYSEYRYELSPPYSCIKVDDAKGQYRFTAKRADFSDYESWSQKVSDTLNLLEHINNILGPFILHSMDLEKLVTEKVEIERGDNGSHTGSPQQNN